MIWWFTWHKRRLVRWLHNNLTHHDWDAEIWNTWFDDPGYNEHMIAWFCTKCGEWEVKHG